MTTRDLIPTPVKTDAAGNTLAYYDWRFPRSEAYEAAARSTLPAGWELYSVIDADKDPEQCARDYGARRTDGRARVHGIRDLAGSPKHLRATFPAPARDYLADRLFEPHDIAAACRWCDEQLAALTIASLLAAKTPARIFVCEASYGARREILHRLAGLGGVQGGAEFTVVTFEGGVEVTLFHDSHQAYGLRCDVAVGFPPASSSRLLDGSPLGLAVSADAAAKFWGLA